MPALLRSVSRPNSLFRRTALFVLLAFQGAWALAPLIESHNDRLDVVHVESTHPKHPYIHNEATCAVCAVRSLYAAAPPRPAPVLHLSARNPVDRFDAAVAPRPDQHSTNLSRAPPLVS